MVTRLLSTPVKSIKMDFLTCYLQCFVGILVQGGEVQKDAKLCFSSTAASRSSRSCYVDRRTGICIPTISHRRGYMIHIIFLIHMIYDTYDIYIYIYI